MIDAPAPVVWRLLVDTRTWPTWGPSVQEVTISDGTDVLGLSTLGRVRIWGRIWVPFVVTQFVPEHYWAWKVGGIDATGHRLDAIDAGSCRLTFEVPLWAAPYSIICLWAIQKIKRIVQAHIRRPDSF